PESNRRGFERHQPLGTGQRRDIPTERRGAIGRPTRANDDSLDRLCAHVVGAFVTIGCGAGIGTRHIGIRAIWRGWTQLQVEVRRQLAILEEHGNLRANTRSTRLATTHGREITTFKQDRTSASTALRNHRTTWIEINVAVTPRDYATRDNRMTSPTLRI